MYWVQLRLQRRHWMSHGRWGQLCNLNRPDVLSDCPVGESLGAIRLRVLHQQEVIVLLQRVSGSQELVERSLVKGWLALRAGMLALHVGGQPRNRDGNTDSTHYSAQMYFIPNIVCLIPR